MNNASSWAIKSMLINDCHLRHQLINGLCKVSTRSSRWIGHLLFLLYIYVKWKFSVVMVLDSRICDVFYDSSQWFDGRIRQGQSEAQILLVSPRNLCARIVWMDPYLFGLMDNLSLIKCSVPGDLLKKWRRVFLFELFKVIEINPFPSAIYFMGSFFLKLAKSYQIWSR